MEELEYAGNCGLCNNSITMEVSRPVNGVRHLCSKCRFSVNIPKKCAVPTCTTPVRKLVLKSLPKIVHQLSALLQTNVLEKFSINSLESKCCNKCYLRIQHEAKEQNSKLQISSGQQKITTYLHIVPDKDSKFKAYIAPKDTLPQNVSSRTDHFASLNLVRNATSLNSDSSQSKEKHSESNVEVTPQAPQRGRPIKSNETVTMRTIQRRKKLAKDIVTNETNRIKKKLRNIPITSQEVNMDQHQQLKVCNAAVNRDLKQNTVKTTVD